MSTNATFQHDDTETSAFVEAVHEGIRAADEGRKHPYSEVRSWLLSWGTDHEKPAPSRG
ncbi:CopG family transcriptional regulator [Acetobacter senegalensis]|uniref:CopG family transcriptional regulator n=1 Tax=Acetobacter senegalensis TaxID=446692 RepID=UPI00128D5D5B|nr:CopG family transcriptional regulator [Acetobacter senegalensis]MPQ72346.1 CopG family transcriptional regulator [Acetobacter senegalensis]